MEIVVQSDVVSFDEFVNEHPDCTELLPDSYGLDGTTLYQMLIQFGIDIVTALIVYVAQKAIDHHIKKKQKQGNNATVVFVFEDGTTVRISAQECNNVNNVIERLKAAYDNRSD